MRQLLLATTNKGKVTEFNRMLSQFDNQIEVLGILDFPQLPEVVESGATLRENARLKAKTIFELTGLPTLADDSGLFIDALGGEPGIFSARWGGYLGNDAQERDQINIKKALSLLENVATPARTAQFRAVVYFYKQSPDGLVIEQEQEGVCPGVITLEPIGEGGFGYDPIFMPAGSDKSLAQLSPGVKDEVSHRGIALRRITPFLLENL